MMNWERRRDGGGLSENSGGIYCFFYKEGANNGSERNGGSGDL